MTQPVVASVPWHCDTCGAKDILHLARSVDVMGLFARLKMMHGEESPSCPGVPADERQIDTPEGAVVNDPREREWPAAVSGIDEPYVIRMDAPASPPRQNRRGRMSGTAALATALAFGAATSPAMRGAYGGPASPDVRRQRAQDKERRGLTAIPAAEAKRARRRERNRTQ